MPSLLSRLKKKKQDEDESEEPVLQEKQPVFKLFRQGTSDLEPVPVEAVDDQFQALELSEKVPTGGSQDSRPSPAKSISFRSDADKATPPKSRVDATTTTSSPHRSHERRLSRRILSLSRRPSLASNRSRSSSYIPDFSPIDRNSDIEAQWEHRATMLARAGPPSPAIPRSDSIFDTGPPKLPPLDVEGQSSGLPLTGVVDEKHSLTTTRQPSFSRKHSDQSSLERELSRPTIAEHGVHKQQQDASNSRDEFLQSAIREHENGNLELAAHLFKKSAQGDEGLPMGQLMYGLSLRHGWGVQRDEARAIHWLRLAASSSAAVEETALRAGMTGGGQMKGDLILAIFELGNCFRHGWGVDMDKELARNYYETAANLGDSDAMFEVAWCYETGFGINKDKYKAAYWYRKSEGAGSKIPGMQWIWKPKYDLDPFVLSAKERKQRAKAKKDKS